jgi:DNA helicase-2/ATP-dependent DNA helicase PcrA
VCNLSLISGYLDSFLEFNRPILTGNFLQGEKFTRVFFNQYIYSLYRRGESEYENTEDPFPKGRVPFLTIHQAKGLEFPVVVLGSPKKSNRGPQTVEKMVAPLLPRSREPLERIAEFDKMRMFYVALSRAMNLLVIAHFRSSHNQVSEPFKSILDEDNFPRIKDLKMEQVPEADVSRKDLPTTYSYTGDYLFYKRCPRNYMVFRRFGFAPSRSQTGFFGNLIHQTVEDLHHLLIDQRSAL